MNGETLSRKRLPLVWGEATSDLPGALRGPSRSRTAVSLPSPGEATEAKLPREPRDQAPHQPCCGEQALQKQGLRWLRYIRVHM